MLAWDRSRLRVVGRGAAVAVTVAAVAVTVTVAAVREALAAPLLGAKLRLVAWAYSRLGRLVLVTVTQNAGPGPRKPARTSESALTVQDP